ncbi:MAG: GNAT family N-acetyltransferase [Bacteroidota bacterium]
MLYRFAERRDIAQIMRVRLSVHENQLSNPELVKEEDCIEYIENRGQGWVCEIDARVVGFAIVDLVERSVWALFLHPDFERRGIGRKLHQLMLDWYFEQTDEPIWLGTDPHTRAARFYRAAGWEEKGLRENGEIRFEISAQRWRGRILPK